MRTIENPWVRASAGLAAGFVLAGCATGNAEPAPTPITVVETTTPTPSPSETIIGVPQYGSSPEALPSPSPTEVPKYRQPDAITPIPVGKVACKFYMSDSHPGRDLSSVAVVSGKANIVDNAKHRAGLDTGIYDLSELTRFGKVKDWNSKVTGLEVAAGGKIRVYADKVTTENGYPQPGGPSYQLTCPNGVQQAHAYDTYQEPSTLFEQ